MAGAAGEAVDVATATAGVAGDTAGASPRPLPPLRATYRLQLHGGFPLANARAVVPYLDALGVSHVYASPILQSHSGSQHGYDVTDPARLDGERGDDGDLRTLAAALDGRAMGLLLDIVPNHMSASPENPYWYDVLRHGRHSEYAAWFDIDWHDPDAELHGRVLLPVLGMPLGEAIASGELTLSLERDGAAVAYHDQRYPIDPQTAPRALAFGLDAAMESAPAGDRPALQAYAALLRRLTRLPARTDADPAAVARRRAEAPLVRREMGALIDREPAVAAQAAHALRHFVHDPGGPARFRRLLDRQPYRLAFWRRAAGEINYRRFFSINELVALNMEDQPVFDATHRLLLEWVADGRVDGLRVDHVDGLRDPAAYLRRLRSAVDARRPVRGTGDAGGAGGAGGRFPILVEKILSTGEALRRDWPVEGTTGYEVLDDLEAVFVDAGGHDRIEARYRAMLQFDRRGVHFRDLARASKRQVLRGSLAADAERLARLFQPIARRDPRTAALAHGALLAAIIEVIVRLPVYRTYVDARMRRDREADGGAPAAPAIRGAPAAPAIIDAPRATPADVALVDGAVAAAAGRRGVPAAALALLGEVLLLRGVDHLPPDEVRDRCRFVSRFQQVSGPATAKGVEDRALYLYFPLASRNEVGCDPERPLANAVADLHAANAERARHWPRSMVCTSTHDTKRGADTRARLDVLSELPDVWWNAVTRWRRLNAPLRRRVGRRGAPDTNTEYLVYQTLVGIWPVDAPRAAAPVAIAAGTPSPEGVPPREAVLETVRTRVVDHLRKAVREGQSRSSWTSPDEAFERAMEEFVTVLLDPARSPVFVAELDALARMVAPSGWWNALARTLLHLTVPGVPDIYQGDELWQLTLVDPDNRQPVDLARRAALLDDLATSWRAAPHRRPELARTLLDAPDDGRVKLFLVWRALAARRRSPALAGGGYLPLTAIGERSGHVVAFARLAPAGAPPGGDTSAGDAAVVVVPRLTLRLADGAPPLGTTVWGDTRLALPPALADRRWRCALTDRVHEPGPDLRLGDLLRDLPGALLLPDREP
ncbi:MAG: malto-oligosyltrehalose synthase [Gemmatimonadaceae bacterium]